MAGGEFADFEAVNRFVKLRVEIVNPEFIEIAKHHVGRAMRNKVEPIIKCLLVMFGELGSAGFHFDEHATGPNEVGKLGAVAGETDAIFEGATFGKGVGVVAEGFEQMQKEGLRVALLVAFEFGSEFGELLESALL
jgi:hypothetical protein